MLYSIYLHDTYNDTFTIKAETPETGMTLQHISSFRLANNKLKEKTRGVWGAGQKSRCPSNLKDDSSDQGKYTFPLKPVAHYRECQISFGDKIETEINFIARICFVVSVSLAIKTSWLVLICLKSKYSRIFQNLYIKLWFSKTLEDSILQPTLNLLVMKDPPDGFFHTQK